MHIGKNDLNCSFSLMGSEFVAYSKEKQQIVADTVSSENASATA